MSTILTPTNKSLFFSKKDPQDPRLGEWVQDLTLEQLHSKQPTWTLMGYPDEEGIRLNGGRLGAAAAPDQIRTFLYKMTPPIQKPRLSLADIGDLPITGQLTQRHEMASEIGFQVYEMGSRLITLGGGHDYGFPDGDAFLRAQHPLENKSKPSKAKPLVLNFDAHLDVRPDVTSPHSGTPFYRLLNKYKSDFDFFEIGIQPQCNSPFHRQWVQDQKGVILDYSAISRIGLKSILEQSLAPDSNETKRPVWISLDMDVFTNSEAPGCSQSFATGLSVHDFLPALHFLLDQFDVRGISLYEVSPPLDFDHRTSKLAALIVYHTLFHGFV